MVKPKKIGSVLDKKLPKIFSSPKIPDNLDPSYSKPNKFLPKKNCKYPSIRTNINTTKNTIYIFFRKNLLFSIIYHMDKVKKPNLK